MGNKWVLESTLANVCAKLNEFAFDVQSLFVDCGLFPRSKS